MIQVMHEACAGMQKAAKALDEEAGACPGGKEPKRRTAPVMSYITTQKCVEETLAGVFHFTVL